MQVAVFESEEEIGRVGAKRVARLLNSKPETVLGLATGSSPVPIYRELVDMYQTGEISFAQTRGFCLDEYVGLDEDHPEAYRNFIDRVFTSHVDFQPGAVRAPSTLGDNLKEAAADYEASIRAAGGVDLQILGIGVDGHIGFCEPGGPLNSRTHVVFLAEQTRRDNARFFEGDLTQVPRMGLTQGLGTILEARELLMVATGENKAEAVQAMVEGSVSAHWPSTVIQYHNDAIVLLDEAAASKLKMREHYQLNWDGFLETEWTDFEW